MSNTCHSTLKIYGSKIHADTARKVADAVFGPCVPDDQNPFLHTETPPPLAVVQISSTDVPPTTLIGDLSAKVPELTFTLIYAIPLGDHRGHVTYRAGAVTDQHSETYHVEDLPRVEVLHAGAGEPGHEVTLPTVKQIATKRFDEGYVYIHEEIAFDQGVPWRDRMIMNQQFERYETLKSLLGLEYEASFARLEHHYKSRAERLAARVKAHDSFRQAIERLETPEIAALLDADDRDALTQAAKVLPKVAPNFRKELATSVE
jgi:hypothetical protein